MKKKSIGLNAILNGFRGILSLLFPLITFPYISHVLGVKGIGIYNFSSSYVNYFSLLAALVISTYAIREGAKYRDNKRKINMFASQLFTINIWSTLVAYVLLFLSLFIFNTLKNYVSCILVFSIQILFTTLGTEWVYSIYEDYLYITIRSIVFNLLSILLMFIFVRNPNDYLNYSLITVIASVGSNLINFVHARKILNIKLVWKINWKYHLKPILVIFASSVAVMIYVNSDVTILGFMKNSYVVGIYSVSAKIYTMVKTVLVNILIVTVPRLAMLLGKKKYREYNSILLKVILNTFVVTLPAMTGMFMLSKYVIQIIAGTHFLTANTSLKILCIALIFSMFSWILSDCILIPAKRENKVLVNTLISALINIIFNILFIPSMNENAAAISTVLAEGYMMISNLYYSWYYVQDIIKSKLFIKNLISIFLGCCGIIIECFLCNIGFSSSILKILSSIILSIIMYVAVLVLLKNDVVMSFFNNLKKRL